MKTLPLLFLDIDQVLYTHVADKQGNIYFGPNPLSINWMKALLKSVPLHIVIISSWAKVLDLPEKDFINNKKHPLSLLTPHLHPKAYLLETPRDVYDDIGGFHVKFIWATPNRRDLGIQQWFKINNLKPEEQVFAILDDSVTCYQDPFYLRHVVPCLQNGVGYEEYQQLQNLLNHTNQHLTIEDIQRCVMQRICNKYQHVFNAFPEIEIR